jgi:hypothetical protein
VLTTVSVGWPTPALGKGTSGHASHSGRGAISRGSAVQAFAFHSGPGTVVTRPEPPFGPIPPAGLIIIQRPRVLFVHPLFFGHRFSTFGAPLFLDGSAATVVEAPFFCDVDGLGFTDLAAFAQHLHDAHGVALDRALSFCDPLRGRCVFFGGAGRL